VKLHETSSWHLGEGSDRLAFPVAFYHGEENWSVSRSFNALFDFTGLESLREYAVDFKHHLCDVSKIEVAKGEPRLRAGMTTLKYGRSDELPSRLREIFETVKQLPEGRISGYIRTVLIYLINVKNNLTWEIIELELDTTLPEQKGEIMKSLAEKWLEEGEQKGVQIGAQQEAAKLTLRLLHQRFGILGAELDERIRSLSTEQLENLIEALSSFTSKDDLLAWLDKEMKPHSLLEA
jgi:hypothetical protein